MTILFRAVSPLSETVSVYEGYLKKYLRGKTLTELPIQVVSLP